MKRSRAILFYGLLLLAAVAAAQWIRAQYVHEWFRWVSVIPAQLTPRAMRRATVQAIELNGSGIAYRLFD